MRKIKKAMSIVLILLLTLSSNVYGAQVNWDLELLRIGDAQRYYRSTSGDEILTFIPNNERVAYNGKTYIINTPEVYVYLNRKNAPCYLNTYVDGQHIGESEFVTGDISGSNYFTGVVVRYLSPGEHDIEIRAYTGYPMDITIKTVHFKVEIPVYIDKAMQNSLEKLNSGTATQKDYEILCVNSSKIFGNNGIDISELNEKVKGQNLDITNVQSTVYSIVDELKNSKLSEDALMHINAGTASVYDYTTVGIEGVTSSNLNSVNGVIKITRDEKNQDLIKEEIQEIVNEIPNKTEEANTRINNGEGTLKDYALVGATKVTGENLEDINWYVHGKDNSTVSKLQSNINTILNALSSINNGSTSTSYYKTIGITTVTSDNITAVANSVKAKKAEKGSDLTRAEIIDVVNEVNSEVNSVSLMMLEEEEISNNKKDIEEEQIDINKIDNDDLKIETSVAENQKKQDSEEEKQIKNDIVAEEIDKIVEIDNDSDSKQEEAAIEKQGTEIEEINIEDINKQEDEATKAVEVNDETDDQTIENIAV